MPPLPAHMAERDANGEEADFGQLARHRLEIEQDRNAPPEITAPSREQQHIDGDEHDELSACPHGLLPEFF